jgi:hypothetical protein
MGVPLPNDTMQDKNNKIKIVLKNVGKFFISTLSGLYLSACVSSQPAVIYDYSNLLNSNKNNLQMVKKQFATEPQKYTQEFGNELLIKINSINSKLTEELIKIPEIADGLTPNETKSLDTLLQITKQSNKKENLDKIINYKHNKSTYNSPLQALFWLIEEGKNKEIKNVLKNYRLENLLEISWNYKGIKPKILKEIDLQLTNKEIDTFIKKMDQEKQMIYDGVSPEISDNLFVFQYQENKSSIPKDLRKIIKNYLEKEESYEKENKNYIRWNEFNTVSNRLNTPKLVEYYLDENFQYSKAHNPQPPKITYKIKKGDCKAYAIFAYSCLKPAGYDIYLLTMDENSPFGHTIAIIKEKNNIFTMDNTFQGLSGPYSSINQIKKKFNFKNKSHVIESIWQIYSRFR